MIYLPNNLKDFDINIEYPFTIFEKNNIFEDTDFNKFLKTSLTWREFYKHLNSEKFLNQIFI